MFCQALRGNPWGRLFVFGGKYYVRRLLWNEFQIDERSVNRYNSNEERRDEHDDAIHAAREEDVHVSSVADQRRTQDNRD